MKHCIPLKNVHFIGIGGIGMSAIAEMLMELGIRTQGSDAKESANTERIRAQGIRVFIGHDASNLIGVDAVVISSAIRADNVELLQARRLGIPVAHRSEMLAEILKYKQSICVSGTHGKTTTSSLIASILMQGHLRPSFIIGGILNSQASNARLGKGKYVVVESDESDGSFLRLPTTISVVTNIDPEHMDFYKTFDQVQNAYKLFIEKTSFYGFSVLCTDHPVVKELITRVQGRKIITYGFDKKADVHADHLRITPGYLIFDIFIRQKNGKFKKIKDVELPMFGRHNVLNALAAVAVGDRLGVKAPAIKKALARFKGIQRRLTLRGQVQGVQIFDDYGHHPVEIKASISALREATKKKLVVVFQPHRYSRFKDLWDDFLDSFDQADHVIVCDVYGAGEDPIDGIDKGHFVEKLLQRNVCVEALPSFSDLPAMIQSVTKSGDVVLCLGAGTISAQSIELVQKLKGKCK